MTGLDPRWLLSWVAGRNSCLTYRDFAKKANYRTSLDTPQLYLAAFRKTRSLMTPAEKITWLLFAATCSQLALQWPYVVLVPGVRTNLFSGLLCFLTLAAAWILGRRGLTYKSPEVLVSAALSLLATVSALHSPTPLSSSYRVLVLLASGLGGFWCARLLLNTPENQRRFRNLCLVLLAAVLLLSLAGYGATGEIHHYLFKGSNHPLITVIYLLSFAPLTLLGEKSRPRKGVAVVLLVLGYAILCLSQRLSVIFIPLGLGILGALWGALRWRHLVAALGVAAVIIGLSVHQISWFKLSTSYPVYRVENIFFSWSIAKQHPVWGIGLRAPRDQFLEAYQIKYPYETRKQFVKNVDLLVTPDNQILTFMTGLGFPFTILYCLAVLILLLKLKGTVGRPPAGGSLPPLALLFSLGLALVHFQVYDGLLFAQDSWFFHILLGLIPVAGAAAAPAAAPAGADVRQPALAPRPEASRGGSENA